MRPSLTVLRLAAVLALSLAVVGCKKTKKEEPVADTAPVTQPATPPGPGGAVPAAPAAALALDGSWRITNAADANGRKYSGNVQVSRSGDAWEMNWKLNDGSAQGGIGIDLGNGVLAAGWGGTQAYGVVVYDVAGGTLTGKWAQKGLRTLGVENLTGPAGLNGNYTITLGKTPTGAAYTGSLRITPKGQLYDLTWNTGGSIQRGVAMLDGAKLIAGWGVAGGAGFVKYNSVSPSRLDGIWAPVGGSKTATEVLER